MYHREPGVNEDLPSHAVGESHKGKGHRSHFQRSPLALVQNQIREMVFLLFKHIRRRSARNFALLTDL